jgi:hypothetical protein
LLNIKLANVGDSAALDGIVGEKLRAVVNDGCRELDEGIVWSKAFKRTVQMVGTADIVTWDHSDEGSGSVGRCLLKATESIAHEGRF